MYSEEIADEICRRLAEGEPYVSICKDDHMPSFSTIWNWEQSKPEFLELSTRALAHGSHYLAHDCIRIADDPEMDAQQKRVRIDTRLRLIGKWNSKRYGEKMQVDHSVSTLSDGDLKAELARQLKGAGLSLSELLDADD